MHGTHIHTVEEALKLVLCFYISYMREPDPQIFMDLALALEIPIRKQLEGEGWDGLRLNGVWVVRHEDKKTCLCTKDFDKIHVCIPARATTRYKMHQWNRMIKREEWRCWYASSCTVKEVERELVRRNVGGRWGRKWRQIERWQGVSRISLLFFILVCALLPLDNKSNLSLYICRQLQSNLLLTAFLYS